MRFKERRISIHAFLRDMALAFFIYGLIELPVLIGPSLLLMLIINTQYSERIHEDHIPEGSLVHDDLTQTVKEKLRRIRGRVWR